jgi:hypothetical protein
MMQGQMDSMMGGMMAFGWLGVAIVLVLLAGAIVALVRLLSADVSRAGGSGLNILLIVFAAIGVLALLGAVGGLFMHWGMRGMMG